MHRNVTAAPTSASAAPRAAPVLPRSDPDDAPPDSGVRWMEAALEASRRERLVGAERDHERVA